MNAAKKVKAARAALVLDQPFFGSLILRLDMVEDPTCPTAWVDGVRIGYSPTFVDGLTHAETVALLAHEVMHVASGHCWRRSGRDPKRWNVACDHAINPILESSGFTLPAGALLDSEYKGKSAEWIFDRLPVDDNGQEGGQSGQNDDDSDDDSESGQDTGHDGQSADSAGQDAAPGEVRDAPADAAETENTEADWSRAVQEAARGAEARGNLPGGAKRFAESRAESAVDWRAVLLRFAQQVSAADYTWTRPNARYMAQGLYLPSLRSVGMGPLAIAVDTSVSIDQVLLAQFAAEVAAVVDAVEPERVDVLYCDTTVHRTETFERGDPIELHAVGGGGTDFRPVFVAIEDDPPVALIYLTDMYGTFPDTEPDYPVLWAASSKRQGPFGETVFVG